MRVKLKGPCGSRVVFERKSHLVSHWILKRFPRSFIEANRNKRRVGREMAAAWRWRKFYKKDDLTRIWKCEMENFFFSFFSIFLIEVSSFARNCLSTCVEWHTIDASKHLYIVEEKSKFYLTSKCCCVLFLCFVYFSSELCGLLWILGI